MQIIANGKYKESQSIIAVEAVDIIDNYNIIDLEGNPISKEDASEYLIVIDGQHRITAFVKLNVNRNQSDQITIPNIHIESGLTNIRELLADLSMVGHSWNNADKVCVAAICNDSPILNKINELKRKNFNISTASLICTGTRFKQSQLTNFIAKGDKSCLPKDEVKAVARADKFITTAMAITGMKVSILTKRYYINGFNSFAAARTDDEAFKALSSLTIGDFSVSSDNEFVEILKNALQQKAA